MIALQRFDSNDYTQLIEWIDSKKILMQFGGPEFSYPLTVPQIEKHLRDPKRQSFKVIDLDNNITIGHAEIYNDSKNKKTLKICRVLIGDKSQRGKGLGNRIINELLKIIFIKQNMEKAELNVFDWNIGAIKCYEKVGFIVNPKEASKLIMNGELWKTINMIIEKKDWKNI